LCCVVQRKDLACPWFHLQPRLRGAVGRHLDSGVDFTKLADPCLEKDFGDVPSFKSAYKIQCEDRSEFTEFLSPSRQRALSPSDLDIKRILASGDTICIEFNRGSISTRKIPNLLKAINQIVDVLAADASESPVSSAPADTQPDARLSKEVLQAVVAGNHLQAIRLYRDLSGQDLEHARAFVLELQSKLKDGANK
jgi:ribosomal protein L7/L12